MMTVQLFVHDFAEGTADSTLYEALSRCGLEGSPVTWTRGYTPSGAAAGFGFADVMELNNAGRILKVVGGIGHDSKLPFRVAPDASLSSKCMAAAEATEVPGLDDLREQITAIFHDSADGLNARLEAEVGLKVVKEGAASDTRARNERSTNSREQQEASREASREARVQAVLRLQEERKESMSEEVYAEIKAFRLGQARTEIAEDDERRYKLLALVEERRRQRRADAKSKATFGASTGDAGDVASASREERERAIELKAAAAPKALVTVGRRAPVKMKLKASKAFDEGEGIAGEGAKREHADDEDEDEDDGDDDDDDSASGRKRKLVVDDTADKLARANVLKRTKALLEAPRMREVIVKHVEKYLGEANQEFTKHVLSLVQAGTTKEALIEKVTPILDDDAAKFVADLTAELEST